MSDELKGMLLGVIGVAIFSITLPATRIAVLGGLDAVFVGLGRAVAAAAVAALILAVKRQPLPDRRHWGRLMVVALGVVLGLLIIINVVFFQQGIIGWAQDKWPERFGIIVAHPPYIRSAAIASLQPEIARYEPAYDSDYDIIRDIKKAVGDKLKG